MEMTKHTQWTEMWFRTCSEVVRPAEFGTRLWPMQDFAKGVWSERCLISRVHGSASCRPFSEFLAIYVEQKMARDKIGNASRMHTKISRFPLFYFGFSFALVRNLSFLKIYLLFLIF